MMAPKDPPHPLTLDFPKIVGTVGKLAVHFS
jgi:hypothetical protein